MSEHLFTLKVLIFRLPLIKIQIHKTFFTFANSYDQCESLQQYDLIFTTIEDAKEMVCQKNVNKWLVIVQRKPLRLMINHNVLLHKQIKFRYGNVYEIIKQNDQTKIQECMQSMKQYQSLEELMNTMPNDRGMERIQILFDTHILKHMLFPFQSYFFNVNLGDAIRDDDYKISYNRQLHQLNNMIFPLRNYQKLEMFPNDMIPYPKKKNVLIWRGSTTGEVRVPFITNIMNKYGDSPLIDVGLCNIVQGYMEEKETLEPYRKSKRNVMEQYQYKFVLCIEGNDVASNFVWALKSNCVPFHVMPFQFHTVMFSEDIRPFVHFIPVEQNGSDLLDKINWCIQHPKQAMQIARNGQQYSILHAKQINELVIQKMIRMYPFVKES